MNAPRASRVAHLPMTSVLRARAIGETRGFMKALIDTKSDRILGFTMLGADAGEVIARRARAAAFARIRSGSYSAKGFSRCRHRCDSRGLTARSAQASLALLRHVS